MKFHAFKVIVLDNLGPDAARTGQGLEQLRDRAIVNAMVDLQRFVKPLRLHNTAGYTAGQLTADGRCQTGNLAAGVKPTEWWIVSVADADIRYRLDPYSYADRFDLINGYVPDERYYYAIGTDNSGFIIHPAVKAGVTTLEIIYDGIKTVWASSDDLNDSWTEATAEAVAEYTKARIVRAYDKDSARRAAEHDAQYVRLRRALFLS
jgi:hypothetical protein